jgi:hypothetical protein
MRAVRAHLALHPDVMRVHIYKDEGRSHCGWKLTRREIVAAGPLPALQLTVRMWPLEVRECFAVFEWAGNRVSVRFGTPNGWQGAEAIVDRSALRVVA